ncbi:hypothetical protein SCOR_15180 [Sulfidibacter corallicola]|uniref:Uncharacterized protein n=1 Tax=Sulfidibacter corallicola TaxID=2818388 RepID=A0A8A4TW69_SULCO|nr:hypothetical protein [Sulfidibacter corallicola]QTD54189.1 hypothetical protein J3U87_17220 [Sulfidibacter corallicola]
MAVKRTGDWQKAREMLSDRRLQRVSEALQQATHKASLLLVREIKRGIVAQAPGGKAFEPLAESTIKRKGSSKALIDTPFLIHQITQRIMRDKAFVGLLRGTDHPNGEDLANIGAVMEFGATINHPNGATIIIPPRPFLHPVMEKYRDDIRFFYSCALQRILGY